MKHRTPLEELRERQQNLTPNDVLRNATLVDSFLARGNVRFTVVQRVGALMIGLFYLLGSSVLLARAITAGFLLWVVPGAILIFAGIKITVNALTAPAAPVNRPFP